VPTVWLTRPPRAQRRERCGSSEPRRIGGVARREARTEADVGADCRNGAGERSIGRGDRALLRGAGRGDAGLVNLMIVRHGALYCLVRCSTWFTRRGDWSDRYPAIAVTATLLRARSFTLDGEAVVCGSDGVAIFDAFHRRGTVSEAMLYAFDLLELDGDDPYRSGPSRDWIKVKNPNSPAMIRAREAEW